MTVIIKLTFLFLNQSIPVDLLILIDISQLNLILEVTGYPSESLLNQINQDARTFLENKEPKTKRVNFNEYFNYVNCPEGLIKKLNRNAKICLSLIIFESYKHDRQNA